MTIFSLRREEYVARHLVKADRHYPGRQIVEYYFSCFPSSEPVPKMLPRTRKFAVKKSSWMARSFTMANS